MRRLNEMPWNNHFKPGIIALMMGGSAILPLGCTLQEERTRFDQAMSESIQLTEA